MTNLLNIALNCIQRGWFVHPLKPCDKVPITEHGKNDATRDETKLQAWWADTPKANVGISCGPSGLCVLDADHGLTCMEDFIAWRDRNGLPVTYAVRSGRRPEFGVQSYYAGSLKDGKFELDGVRGDIKSAGGLVLAAGSIHPDSKEKYQVIVDAPIAPAPVGTIERSRVKPLNLAKDDAPIRENRNTTLTSIGGKLRNDGLSPAALELALIQVNEDRCDPPLEEEEVRRIAASVSRYAIPEPDPKVTIGKPDPDSVAVSEKSTRPVFPDDAWAGTIFGEFADIVCRENFIRKRLASESFRAITGAIAGDQVTCGIAGVRMREYHVVIANRQSGKSYAMDLAVAFYSKPSLKNLFEPLLMLDGGTNHYRLSGIGAQRFLPGSANSFVDELTREPKRKKGEDVNVILGPKWNPTARLITIQGEAMALFSRMCSPDWTGQALSALVTDLYDSLDAEVAITKDRATPGVPVQLQYSMLLCTQPQIWQRYMAAHMMDSGLFGRFYIVGSEFKPTKVLLPDYSDPELFEQDFGSLRREVFSRLEYLREHPLRMTIAPEAKRRLQEWENGLPDDLDMDRDLSSRMGLHVWRAAMARAWGAIPQRMEITLDDAEAAIKLGEYQVKMRQFYAPIPGDSPRWKHLNAVRAAVELAGQISIRDLRRNVRGDRFPEDFEWALKYLENRPQIVTRKQGRSPIVGWVIDN